MMVQRFNYGVRRYEFHFPVAGDHIGRQMAVGFYEQPMLEAIKDLELRGAYIDVGAHVGNHTLFFANECCSTKVVAIEPSPDTFACLETNVRKNLRRPPASVELRPECAGSEGQIAARVSRVDRNSGMDRFALHEQGRPVATIDSIAAELTDPVALIKIDAEGFEAHALRGALCVIRRDRPLLVIEGADAGALAIQEAILQPLGYARGKCWNATPTYFWTPRAQVCVVITTYNRPAEARSLLEDIVREKGASHLLVLVYDDCSTADYSEVRRFIGQQGWIYVRTGSNFGKIRFAQLFNLIFARLKSISFETVVFLQDDMRLCSRFFERALALWHGLDDSRKLTLNLHVDCARLSAHSWTKKPKRLLGNAELAGWVDCVFLAERKFLRALQYRLESVSPGRWRKRPRLGSGVGEQISRRLHQQNWNMYRVTESLLYHSLVPSQLNPLDRIHNRCVTVRFADGGESVRRLITPEPIIASMATIPSRVNSLQKTVASLLHQVDRLNIYLNGFVSVPPFLAHPGIVLARSQDSGDRGDAGKFWWAPQVSGYHFTVDDDIAYPPEYCEVIIKAIESQQQHVVAGVHGIMLARPFRSYFRSRTLFHFEAALETPQFVHILGTGTLGYHSSTLQINPQDFPTANLADIYFARLAQSHGVPLLCLPRGRNWLRRLDPPGPSIYTTSRRNQGEEETRLIRSFGPWQLLKTAINSAARPAAPAVDASGSVPKMPGDSSARTAPPA